MVEKIILEYTSIVSSLADSKYGTTCNKFEYDMNKMKEFGFKSVPLHFMQELDSKSDIGNGNKIFTVVFVGGYLDNYTNAFEIIKKLNIHVSIFIATDLVGLNTYPGINNFIPHFSWLQAQEMVDSGLVKIYPMWHNFDRAKEFDKEIVNKIDLLSGNLFGNGNIIAITGCPIQKSQYLESIGIKTILCSIDEVHDECKFDNIAPMIFVNPDEEVTDLIELYSHQIAEKHGKTSNISQNRDDKYRNITLPIEIHPIAKNYLHVAFPLSVIGAERTDKAERQVINHLIDVIFKPSYNVFDYHCDSYEHWECIDCKTMSKDLLEINNISVCEFIKNGLKLGYYCDIWLDAYYIPQKRGYNTTHYSHGMLIYGYDAELEIFKSLSYDDNGKYINIDISLKSLIKACSNTYFTKLCLIKTKTGINAKYDISKLYTKLLNYTKSYHYDVDTSFNKDTTDQFFQKEACERFVIYIQKLIEEMKQIPLTAMYSYAEHKKLMLWRLNYIAAREKLSCNYINAVKDDFALKTEMVLNLAIKYNMTLKYSSGTQIVDMMNRLNRLEICMMEDLLAQLKENVLLN